MQSMIFSGVMLSSLDDAPAMVSLTPTNNICAKPSLKRFASVAKLDVPFGLDSDDFPGFILIAIELN